MRPSRSPLALFNRAVTLTDTLWRWAPRLIAAIALGVVIGACAAMLALDGHRTLAVITMLGAPCLAVSVLAVWAASPRGGGRDA